MRSLSVALSLASACCVVAGTTAPAEAPPAPVVLEARRTLAFHADDAFGPLERAFIAEAMEQIEHDTSGMLRAEVSYDVSFDSTLSIVEHGHDSVLCRAPVLASYVGERVLGRADVIDSSEESYQARVFLVADRMHGPFVFKHVAMHELLHAFGLRHIDDPLAIMHWSIDASQVALIGTCMTRSDAVEACRVYGCDPERLDYCR